MCSFTSDRQEAFNDDDIPWRWLSTIMTIAKQINIVHNRQCCLNSAS
jgi:hypothetical protein